MHHVNHGEDFQTTDQKVADLPLCSFSERLAGTNRVREINGTCRFVRAISSIYTIL